MRHSAVFSVSPHRVCFPPPCVWRLAQLFATVYCWLFSSLNESRMENNGFMCASNERKKCIRFLTNESLLTYNFDDLFVLTLNTKRCVRPYLFLLFWMFILKLKLVFRESNRIGFGNEVVAPSFAQSRSLTGFNCIWNP